MTGRQAPDDDGVGGRGAAALVVGLGSPDRGDDAVGPTVAREVAARALPGIEVVEHEDPTSLVELWAGRPVAVVIDAVRSGRAAGAVVVLETGLDRAPLPGDAWAATGRGGTHALGLATAVELARALQTLPPRLVVIGVEAARLDHGAPLSDPVRNGVPAAVEAVLSVLQEQQATTAVASDAAG